MTASATPSPTLQTGSKFHHERGCELPLARWDSRQAYCLFVVGPEKGAIHRQHLATPPIPWSQPGTPIGIVNRVHLPPPQLIVRMQVAHEVSVMLVFLAGARHRKVI